MRVATVRCIVKNGKHDKILLCKSVKDGHYFLPGGGIKFQELAEEAIIREFSEEMGLNKDEVIINNFIGIVENMFGESHGIDVVFSVSLKREDVKSKEDKIEFSWFNLSELNSVDLRPSPIKEMILDETNNHVISITCERNIKK